MQDQKVTRNQKEKEVDFKHTLNLPQTDFPMRSNPIVDDKIMLDRWEKEDMYRKTFELNKGAEKFILHDGPPYANGHLHLGHAYNVILKDIVTKSQRMMGKQVPVTPGWDCHGLPIELQVTKQDPSLTGAPLKTACRAYAQKWIDIQKTERKSFGVFMDWDRPYTTMDFDYEANTLRAFGDLVAGGYIERKNKTVPWCASCQTVLAIAEIEYHDRKDPSIYVLFSFTEESAEKAFPAIKNREINVVVWTTTPWTIPLNRAVLIKPGAFYQILDVQGQLIVVGKERADALCALIGCEKIVVQEFLADTIAQLNLKFQHPLIELFTVPLIFDDSVLLSDGTAFVHSAPGCGPEDYEVGVKNGLEIYSPIAADGTYTDMIKPEELIGVSTKDAQGWVIKKLAETGRLLFKTSLSHSYPHCWRCRNGLIFRATKQWFCDLEKHDLKRKTLQAADTIKTVPEKSINRLKATIEGRFEWCLSRQRQWGVPIPALICIQCDHAYIAQDMINAVADHVQKHGIEFWDTISVSQLTNRDFVYRSGVEFWEPLAAEIETVTERFECLTCKSSMFKKENDILDVWFDSGISHYAVLKQRSELAFPADMYLEGKDQHRGWFQSSLLTSMILNGEPSTKILVTHGFTVDAQGRKMSKSLGNVMAPQELMNKLGTDGLRLWVSSIDCSSEAVVSPALLQNIQEVFRKIRNTCRFLVSVLYDFDIDTDGVELPDLHLIDQYALQELFKYNHAFIGYYKKFDFTALFHSIGDYCSVQLSSFYLDIVKDRLYVSAKKSKNRRSAQTTVFYILDALVRAMAPILSFTAEQLSDHYQTNKTESIHLQPFNRLENVWEILIQAITLERSFVSVDVAEGVDIETLQAIDTIVFNAEHEKRWETLQLVRSGLLKALEIVREQGIIKHSLEADVTVYFEDLSLYVPVLHEFFAELNQKGESAELFFKEFIIVSRFDIVTSPDNLIQSSLCPGLYIRVNRAEGQKCPRCWQWHTDTHEHNLCGRCSEIVKKYDSNGDSRKV